ncbi:MAG: SdpI family protein [Verrucomicrobia bacterium]|nr:SdpI family protein [Verrucomicrobiota bacterium]
MSRTSILIAGLLLLLLNLPLAFGWVPRNKYYGFRTAVSMKSDEHWYAVNACGGRRLAWWSMPVIAIGIAGWFIPENYREAYARYTPFLVFGAVAIAFISVGVWSRRSLP